MTATLTSIEANHQRRAELEAKIIELRHQISAKRDEIGELIKQQGKLYEESERLISVARDIIEDQHTVRRTRKVVYK